MTLDLSNNNIKYLPKEIKYYYRYLIYLVLFNNNITYQNSKN